MATLSCSSTHLERGPGARGWLAQTICKPGKGGGRRKCRRSRSGAPIQSRPPHYSVLLPERNQTLLRMQVELFNSSIQRCDISDVLHQYYHSRIIERLYVRRYLKHIWALQTFMCTNRPRYLSHLHSWNSSPVEARYYLWLPSWASSSVEKFLGSLVGMARTSV